ncbi:carbonic anhydrase [Erwinia sp. PsM31]|uniref:carbonic anhydrase n=1 Tax=Erwinia sp. PsM31 TaxID=3030535 RepID=UPI00263B3EB7|nr:carbonic anhydrase [Erwinia sp. PsM31]MDN4628616.1 carbonic anhydrase [Erwinia sp. PsM31]
MKILNRLLAQNRSWAQQQANRDPNYFLNLMAAKPPQALWIGCSDSRVPAEVLTNAHPGELFVHRNIANMVLEEDESLMSVLQYALGHLQIDTLILCGHYDCDGIQAALALQQVNAPLFSDPLTRYLQKLYDSLNDWMAVFQPEMKIATTGKEKLTEYHLMAQAVNLINAWPVKSAIKAGRDIAIYGCVHELHSGYLKRLV